MLNKEIFTIRSTNGDVQLSTTGSSVMDFFLYCGTYPYRDQSNGLNKPIFWESLRADYDLTIRTILRTRDARGGGKIKKIIDDFFEVLLMEEHVDQESANIIAKSILAKMPELGYWKNVIKFAVTPNERLHEARCFASDLIRAVWVNPEHPNRNLMIKYLPVKFSKGAAFIARNCGLYHEPEWRRAVVAQRATVESLVCSKHFDAIDYSTVPTQAMKLHRKAFRRFDDTRYSAYLGSLVTAIQSGESVAGQIKSQGNLAPEVVHRVAMAMQRTGHRQPFRLYSQKVDADSHKVRYEGEMTDQMAIDCAQWDAMPLPEFDGTILPLIDSSGSMGSPIQGADCRAIDVAMAMGLLMAKANKGAFHNQYMAFSDQPYLVDFSEQRTLADQIACIQANSYAGSTNLMSAFDLILKMAVDNKLPQAELPSKIVLVSDMQFNGSFRMTNGQTEMSVFATAKAKFSAAGYVLPTIVYWYVTQPSTHPVAMHEGNTMQVSGFSEMNMNMIMRGEIDPWKTLLNELRQERYDWLLPELIA